MQSSAPCIRAPTSRRIPEGRTKSVRKIQAEVDDARAKRRDRPRKDTRGLPSLDINISFSLTPEEHATVEKALAKVAQEMAQSLGKNTSEEELLKGALSSWF